MTSQSFSRTHDEGIPLSEPLYGAGIRQSVYRLFAKCFDFRGEASRSEFWVATAFLIVAFFPLSALYYRLGVDLRWVFSVIATVPYLSLSCRRLANANFPRLLCAAAFVPVIGWIAFFGLMLVPGKGPERKGQDEGPGKRPLRA